MKAMSDRFRACYSDWKLVKTRKVVQIVFEVPIEYEKAAYAVLGGMPDAAAEKWFGIVRLPVNDDDMKEVMPNTVAGPDKAKSVSDPSTDKTQPGRVADKASGRAPMSLAQRAGMLCNDRLFWIFLEKRFPFGCHDPDDAAWIVRRACGVKSRADIDASNVAAAQWHEIDEAYRAWMVEPAVVPA